VNKPKRTQFNAATPIVNGEPIQRSEKASTGGAKPLVEEGNQIQ
jgi:hypothetical protein